jgi:transcriptional regulator with XRE-family HTH domain
MSDERPALAEFLRNRRERVKPADVGLPDSGRRRTPGLRREELATIAGISVDYLVRLEQGREVNPSTDVLGALADALQLTQDEAHHMGMLANKHRLAPRLCPSKTPSEELDETTLMLLGRLDGTPAFVLEPTGDISIWNDAYERLMRDTGLFDVDPLNLVRYTFLSPQARTLYKEWDTIAREQVGNLRSVAVFCNATGSPVHELVGELSVNSPEFAQMWACHDVAKKTWGTKTFLHPVGGELNLRYQALLLPDESHRSLVSYLPADEATATALDRLVAPEPARTPLRVVANQ